MMKRLFLVLAVLVFAAPVFAQRLPATEIQARTNTGTDLSFKLVFDSFGGVPVMEVVDTDYNDVMEIYNTGQVINYITNAAVSGSISYQDGLQIYNHLTGGQAITSQLLGIYAEAYYAGSAAVDQIIGQHLEARNEGSGAVRYVGGLLVDAIATNTTTTTAMEGLDVSAGTGASHITSIYAGVFDAGAGTATTHVLDLQADATHDMSGALKGIFTSLNTSSTHTVTGGMYGEDMVVATDETGGANTAYGVNVLIKKNSGGGSGLFGTAYGVKVDIQNTTTAYAIYTSGGNIRFGSLTSTGSAGSKKVVCVDTSTGVLYASSTGTDCSN